MKQRTGCDSIDKILSGGFERGVLTLIYGEAGSGKTNLCIQTAIQVISEKKKVIYIDTEGLSLERVKQIAGHKFNEILPNLIIREVTSLEEQTSVIDEMIKIADATPEIGLIIVDSATVYYRINLTLDGSEDSRYSLTHQVTSLLRLARKKNIPVLLTTQVYTDMKKGTYEPIGGHMLVHNTKVILRLEKTGINTRRLTIIKHRSLPEDLFVDFKLVQEGLR